MPVAADRLAGDAAPELAERDAPGRIVVEQLGWLAPDALPRVSGLDLAGPRALALWQIDPATGRQVRLARGTSGSDGRFAFEQLLLPADGAWVRVLPEGLRPGENPGDPDWLPGRRPDPPQVLRTGDTLDVHGLLEEAVAVGRHEDGWEFRRPLAEISATEVHSIAQRLPDGRTSPWILPIESEPFLEKETP